MHVPTSSCIHLVSSVLQIIDKIVEHHLHRIYVVDTQGKAVGVVTLTDMLRHVTEEARAA